MNLAQLVNAPRGGGRRRAGGEGPLPTVRWALAARLGVPNPGGGRPCLARKERGTRPLAPRPAPPARMLFHSITGGVGFDTWKKFDKELARELSTFFVGKLYSREVISQKQRELYAVASLTVLNRPHEVRAHLHAARNVGATRQEIAEVIFQQVTYGGMPVVVEALAVFKEVLEERGEWEG